MIRFCAGLTTVPLSETLTTALDSNPSSHYERHLLAVERSAPRQPPVPGACASAVARQRPRGRRDVSVPLEVAPPVDARGRAERHRYFNIAAERVARGLVHARVVRARGAAAHRLLQADAVVRQRPAVHAHLPLLEHVAARGHGFQRRARAVAVPACPPAARSPRRSRPRCTSPSASSNPCSTLSQWCRRARR